VDNEVLPAKIYLFTDPSGAHGPKFIPAMFVFIKPEIGSGLLFYDAANPPPYPPVPCDGCALIEQEIAELSSHAGLPTEAVIGITFVSFVLGVMILLLVGCIVAALVVLLRRNPRLLSAVANSSTVVRMKRSLSHKFRRAHPRDEAESDDIEIDLEVLVDHQSPEFD
jgi:hypothetical protein